MAALLFAPAGTLGYWQAWAFLAVFGGCALAITLYLMVNDRSLLARRVYAGPTAEKERSQQLIQSLTSLGFIAMLIVPALDHRFGWSAVPFWCVVAGDVLVTFGFLIIFRVYRENSFTSGVIEVAADQRVVSTGPYAMVRHPMYLGAMPLLVGMAISLASWWAILVFLLIMPMLIWRIAEEERFLAKNLRGYTDYQRRVKYRLLPYVW